MITKLTQYITEKIKISTQWIDPNRAYSEDSWQTNYLKMIDYLNDKLSDEVINWLNKNKLGEIYDSVYSIYMTMKNYENFEDLDIYDWLVEIFPEYKIEYRYDYKLYNDDGFKTLEFNWSEKSELKITEYDLLQIPNEFGYWIISGTHEIVARIDLGDTIIKVHNPNTSTQKFNDFLQKMKDEFEYKGETVFYPYFSYKIKDFQ